jgi:hypothetical protein
VGTPRGRQVDAPPAGRRRRTRNNRAVIFVDIETLRGRPYPDVLIELLKQLLDHLEERLLADGRYRSWRRRRLVARVRSLSDAMSQLLAEPQTAEHTIDVLRAQARHSSRGSSLTATARLRGGARNASVGVAGSGEVASGEQEGESTQATVAARFERTKMDGLVEAAIVVRDVLGDAQEELAVSTLVVLDDFQHIALDDQAEVLAYLHQVVKGLDISLKVCAVKRLLKPYAAGDPPVGMQPEHDAGTISLDVTLERFVIAKEVLEQVLAGICAPFGIEVDRLLTDGGRERLVLASGGVARDYISLTRRALRNATERPAYQYRVKNRITAEDVARATADLYEQKQEELKRDAEDDAEGLRSRLGEIVRFCIETNRTNVFLVETTKLEEERWGKDIQALADLRLVHRVDTLSTRRGGVGYAGRKFAAFTLDLSTWTSTRSERIRPINFWEREGRGQIREERLIYTPELASSRAGRSNAPTEETTPVLDDDEQLAFDDELGVESSG